MHQHFFKKCGAGIILLLCINATLVFGQDQKNSLNRDLETLGKYAAEDAGKVNLLREIALQYMGSDPVLAKKYFHASAGLAHKIGYIEGQHTSYSRLGILCMEDGEYDSAIYFHLKCLKIRESIRDNIGIAHTYNNLGSVYRYLLDSSKALYYLRKALEMSKKYKDTLTVGNAYMNLGGLYHAYGQNKLSRYWYLQALDIFQKINDKASLAKIFNNIGGSFFSEGNYKTALVYFLKKAKIEKELSDYPNLANVYNNIAQAYSYLNKDSALYYFNLAIAFTKKIHNYSILEEIYGNMADFYKRNHEFEKSLAILVKYINLKDSLFTIDQSRAIADMQTKYETEKKEQQIAVLTGDKKFAGLVRNFLLVALAFILIISVVMFNRYRFELKVNKIIASEKKRSDELLLNILPAETAEELKKYGKTSAKNYDEVSVLFADIKGFSLISQQMSAQALVADLDRYFGAFDLISEKFGLEKIKTIGDAYLCAGGLPNPGKGTPEEVIKAAMEMQEYVEQVKIEKSLKNEPYFEIRVGIHTGPVVAGVVGIKKFAYDIWGDTVNTAARMQQYGEAGKLNVSQQTYDKIKDIFHCTFRGNIEVKNKGVFAMYFVDGIKTVNS